MATLAEIKGSEVKLRNSLAREGIPEFSKEDIEWAYRFVRSRRRLAERKCGIGRLY